ncbi:MAG: hypothetical protein OES57_19100 [Acidimicrobiia bacterium]|nr:hypothetical protein [Acidimicrobiia bacterium]
MSGPTLTDDEVTLARYADELARGVRARLGGWVIACIRRVADEQDLAMDHVAAAHAAEAAELCGAEIGARVEQLLASDIGEQTANPLQIVRDGVRYPTGVLRDLGAQPMVRDRFAVEAFPDDDFGLAPATFADIDPSLHEPGLRWGAAKAHVHLRRRREGAT